METFERRILLAADLSVSIDDGSSFSFPNVRTAYTLDISNVGPDPAPATNIVHNATNDHTSVSWLKTVLPGGTPFTPEFDLGGLNGANGFTVSGSGGFDRSGRSVRWAGDVNGDSRDDLVIGAHLANANGTDSGLAIVIFGSDNPWPANINSSELNGSNGFQIRGAAGNQYAGFSVSGAGDVNNDGFEDLAVGAKLSSSNGVLQAGSTFIVFGGTSVGSSGAIDVANLNGSNGFAIHGIDLFDRSGESVIGLGDVNGDNIDDVLIGAAEADPNGSRSGESYVVFGQTGIGNTGTLDLSSLDGSNGFTINGITETDFSGITVNRAGDVNNDGVLDLIVGTTEADPNSRNKAGESYVVFGGAGLGSGGTLELSALNGSNGVRIDGAVELERAGIAVSEAGDVNQDGIDDLIIGAPNASPDENRLDAGKAYVVFGASSLGGSGTLDLANINGTNGFVIHGGANGDQFGSSVSGATDINGDGVADVLIGAPFEDANGIADSGAAYLILGSEGIGASGVVELSDLDGLNGFAMRVGAGTDRLGAAISRAGDVNNDGIGDLIVSADLADTSVTDGGRSYVVFGRNAPARAIVAGSGNISETLDVTPGANINYRIEAVTRSNVSGTVVKTLSATSAADQASTSDTNSVSTDQPLVQFSQAAYQENENGTPSGAAVTLTRSGEIDVTSTVIVASVGSGAAPAGPTDFDATPLEIVFLPGQTSRTVDLPIDQDSVDEVNERVALSLVAFDDAAIGNVATSQLTILDDDVAGISITPVQSEGGPPIVGPLSLQENDPPIIFEVSVSSQPAEAVDLDFSISPFGNISIDDGMVSTFHIGNSLTQDGRPDLLPHTVGTHLDFGKSLNHINNNPNDPDVFVQPYGSYVPALNNFDWDRVTVQPYGGPTSTLATDVAFIQQVATLEPNAEILLYEPWPNIFNTTYADAWNVPLATNNPTFTVNTAAYYAALETELDNAGVEYRTVPIGAILEAVDIAARAGQIPNLNNAEELYRDPIHLSEEGRAVAYSTFYYAIHGDLPTTIPFPHGLAANTVSAINVHIQNVSPTFVVSDETTSIAFNDVNWQSPQYVYAALKDVPLNSTTRSLQGTSQSGDPFYDSIWNNTSLASIDLVGDNPGGGGDITTGLVSYWDFEGDLADEAPSGTVNDVGTFRNGASITTGGLGQNLTLDGADDFVAIGTSFDINRGARNQHSVALWFNSDNVSQSGRQVIYQQGGTLRGANIYIENGSVYAGAWNVPVGWQGTWHSTSVESSTWHHVSMSLDANAGMLDFFVDGQLVSSGFAATFQGHNPATIGASDRGTRYFSASAPGYVNQASSRDAFKGAIDDVRIYDRVLAPADSATLASDAPTTTVDLTANLVAHLNFDNNSLDSAPSGTTADNATLVSATYSNDGVGGGSLAVTGQGLARVGSSFDINRGSRSAHSISLLFKADDVNQAGRQVLYGQGGTVKGANIYLENGSVYLGAWTDDGGANAFSGSWVSSPVTSQDWHHVTLVVDGVANQLTGYVDGINIGSLPAGPLRGHNATSIGGSDRTSRYFGANSLGYVTSNGLHGLSGQVDEVRVYKRALASDAVLALSNENPDQSTLFAIALALDVETVDQQVVDQPETRSSRNRSSRLFEIQPFAVDLLMSRQRRAFVS